MGKSISQYNIPTPFETMIDQKLISEPYWEVALDGLKYGDSSLVSNQKAIIDSGTSLLAGPTDAVAQIAKAAGATSLMGKEYVVDCSKLSSLPNLEVTLGGHSFTLTPDDYIINMQGECLFAFTGLDVPAPRGPLWIMGDIFMRKYYCVFDYGNKQMQIAPAATKAADSSEQIMI